MLHQFLRSLGRPWHTARGLSRRKFSSNGHRSDTAIERLEERMLLSANPFMIERWNFEFPEWEVDPSSDNPNMMRAVFEMPVDGNRTTSATIRWSVLDDGQPVQTGTESITFDGHTVQARYLLNWRQLDRPEIIYRSYEADITSLLRDSVADVHEIKADVGTPTPQAYPIRLSVTRIYEEPNVRPTVRDSHIIHSYPGTEPSIVWSAVGTDANYDSLSHEIISRPTVGKLELNSTGSYTLTMPEGFEGDASFSYRMWDGREYSDVASVTVTFVKNEVPRLQNRTIVSAPNQPVAGKLEWHDPEGDVQTVWLLQQPEVGTLVLNDATGEFVYTPPEGFVGTASFSYRLWGIGITDAAYVQFVIGSPTAEPRPGLPAEIPSTPHPVSPPPKGVRAGEAKSSEQSATPTKHTVNDLPTSDDLGKQVESIQQGTIFVPPSTGGHDRHAVRVTTVIYATDSVNVERWRPQSLRLTRLIGQQLDERDSAKVKDYELRDVNGDGHEDLIAVFDLDWAELWDGFEHAVLTGRASV